MRLHSGLGLCGGTGSGTETWGTRHRDSVKGGGCVPMCLRWRGEGGWLPVVDDLTITENFPTACTQRKPSKGKKEEKE